MVCFRKKEKKVMEGKRLMKAEELVEPDYMLPPALPGHLTEMQS